MKSLNFISIKDASFHLNGSSYPCILAIIHSHQYVRKLFSSGRLTCFSRDSLYSTSRRYCPACSHPQCRIWLRLFLKIDKENYALDLPKRLIPVYKSFLNSIETKTTKTPFSVMASFSLEAKDEVWIFSIHKAWFPMDYFENLSSFAIFNHTISWEFKSLLVLIYPFLPIPKSEKSPLK